MAKEQSLVEIAEVAANKYAAKCWWVDRDELRQEAALAMCEAERTFDPQVGVPRNSYLWIVATRAIGKFLLVARSPVSEKRQALRDGREPARTVTVEDWDCIGGDNHTDDDFDHKRWLKKVTVRVRELLDHVPDSASAHAVVIGEQPAREVAERAGLERRVVYRAARSLRKAIEGDPELFKLWREILG